MNLVLDSGGVSALAGDRARLAALRRRGWWPPIVPAVVLAESLTGDGCRDFHENQLLRLSQVRPVGEPTARAAARLRTATARAGEMAATDAIVAAMASELDDALVLTSDPDDLRDLLDGTHVRIARA